MIKKVCVDLSICLIVYASWMDDLCMPMPFEHSDYLSHSLCKLNDLCMLRFLCLVYSNDILKNITIVKSYARKLVDTTDSTRYQQKMNKSLMESLEIHKEYAGETRREQNTMSISKITLNNLYNQMGYRALFIQVLKRTDKYVLQCLYWAMTQTPKIYAYLLD